MPRNTEQLSAMEAWLTLRNDPAFISAKPEERYETRLALADDLRLQGLIDEIEWLELTDEAVATYAYELG